MATDSQLNANRENAQYSTGPHTEEGKAISSRNALTLGLFTKSDYVRSDEQSEYDQFCVRCVTELNPKGVLEETFVTTIVSATWRLRRCTWLENQLTAVTDLDPMADEHTLRIQISVDRARSQFFNLLHRSTAELRRLQTDRALAARLSLAEPDAPLASTNQMVTAIDRFRRAGHRRSNPQKQSLASNCSDDQQTPRNAPCPCGSGEKFKRCCGKQTRPPVLGPIGKAA